MARSPSLNVSFLTVLASAFIESNLFSKYTYTPKNLLREDNEVVDDDEDDFPLLLQVSLHAFIECLSMFQQVGSSSIMGNMGGQRDVQRSVFNPIRGTLRLVYENDGEPFLIM
jgi:hypothetical protein